MKYEKQKEASTEKKRKAGVQTRLLLFLLPVLLCLCLPFLVSAEDPDPSPFPPDDCESLGQEHEFTYTYWNDEEHDARCNKCGMETSFEHKGTYAPTDEDTHTLVCDDCHATITQYHKYEAGSFTNNDDGTCTGFCTECQYQKVTNYHWFQYTDNENGTCSGVCYYCNAVTDPSQHFWYLDEDAGPSTEEGHHVYCIHCGAKSFESHVEGYVDLDVEELEASGSEKGHLARCPLCGYTSEDAEPEEHDYQDGIPGKYLVGDGIDEEKHYMICEKCGHIDMEHPREHEFTVTPSYEDEESGFSYAHFRRCDVCGFEDMKEHVFAKDSCTDNGDDTHTGVCVECKIEVTSWHNMEEGSFTEDEGGYTCSGFCAGCHAPLTYGHGWREEEGYADADKLDPNGHHAVCWLCGKKSYEEHDFYRMIQTGEEGSHKVYCIVCGYVSSEGPHTFDWRENSDGSGTYHWACTECGYVDETVAAEPHQFQYEPKYYFDGEDFSDYHIGTCTVCGAVVRESHEFDACVDNGDGTHTGTCTVCEAEVTAEHDEEEGSFTENEDGKTCSGYCTYCHATLTYEHAWTMDEEHEDEEIGPDGHYAVCWLCGKKEFQSHELYYSDYDFDIQPGEEERGHEAYCYVCGYYTDVGPHDYAWSKIRGDDENHYKVCTKCGHVDETSAAPHKFQYEPEYYGDGYSSYHTATCTVCGTEVEERHEFGEGVDKEDGTHALTCTVCQYERIEEHYWVFDDSHGEPGADGHHVICEDCGVTDFLPHKFYYSDLDRDYDPESGEEEKGHALYCTGCGYKPEDEPHEYEWGSWYGDVLNHYKICQKCGHRDEAQVSPHVFDFFPGGYDLMGHEAVCSVCHEEVYTYHVFENGKCKYCPVTIPDFTDGYVDPDTLFAVKPDGEAKYDPTLVLTSGFYFASDNPYPEDALEELEELTGVKASDAMYAWFELSDAIAYAEEEDLGGMTIRLPIPGGWNVKLYADTSHYDEETGRYVESMEELTFTVSADGRYLYAKAPEGCENFVLLKTGETAHTHTKNEAWEGGDYAHFHSCATCGEKFEYGGHEFEWTLLEATEGEEDYGLLKGVCKTCGYAVYASYKGELDPGSEHVHIPTGDYITDEKGHWKKCEDEECEEKVLYEEHSFEDDVCTVCGYRRAGSSEPSEDEPVPPLSDSLWIFCAVGILSVAAVGTALKVRKKKQQD